MPEIRPATADDLKQVWHKPIPRAARVFAVVEGDTLLGVGGYYVHEGQAVLFSGIRPEAKVNRPGYARQLLKVAREIATVAKATGMRVVAQADPNIEGSGTLLRHLGFEHLQDGVYKCNS